MDHHVVDDLIEFHPFGSAPKLRKAKLACASWQDSMPLWSQTGCIWDFNPGKI